MPVHTEILGPCRPCLDFQECRMMQIAVAGILFISATYFPPPEQNSFGEQLWGIALDSFSDQLWGSFGEQIWSFGTWLLDAFGSNFEEQFWGATMGNNFAAL